MGEMQGSVFFAPLAEKMYIHMHKVVKWGFYRLIKSWQLAGEMLQAAFCCLWEVYVYEISYGVQEFSPLAFPREVAFQTRRITVNETLAALSDKWRGTYCFVGWVWCLSTFLDCWMVEDVVSVAYLYRSGGTFVRLKCCEDSATCMTSVVLAEI